MPPANSGGELRTGEGQSCRYLNLKHFYGVLNNGVKPVMAARIEKSNGLTKSKGGSEQERNWPAKPICHEKVVVGSHPAHRVSITGWLSSR